ncbi:unnamed protein product [Oppiella nova]|uniref:Cuticle protein n=1 Tax=Oppiella nova TaxID=334625 RepID=A0A7R9M8L5_9ACAR|nr:unnamed protein product [Oppiella nova]CAG2172640.1 unnamed protein product [Oppiella nova]
MDNGVDPEINGEDLNLIHTVVVMELLEHKEVMEEQEFMVHKEPMAGLQLMVDLELMEEHWVQDSQQDLQDSQLSLLAIQGKEVMEGRPGYGYAYGNEGYKPFRFGYNTVDEYGTQMGRQEVADGSGTVRGSYSYRDPYGQYRQVQYVADQGGFRAVVNTNEAGVVPHQPADAIYNLILIIVTLVVIINARDYESPSRRARARRVNSRQSPVAAASYRAPVVSSYSSAGPRRGSAYARPVRQTQQFEEADHPAPEPYSFTYDTTDEFGTTLTRTETGDANGVVTGSYQYRDANGLVRTVEYGDDGSGFRAVVNTNEPGVVSHRAADAEYIKT